jgi:hypothetical protein
MAVIWRKHLPTREVPRTPPAQSALQCVEAVATSTIRHGRLFQRQNQRQNVGGGRFEKRCRKVIGARQRTATRYAPSSPACSAEGYLNTKPFRNSLTHDGHFPDLPSPTPGICRTSARPLVDPRRRRYGIHRARYHISSSAIHQHTHGPNVWQITHG